VEYGMAVKYFSPPHIYSISCFLTTGNDPTYTFLGQTINRLCIGIGLFRSTIHKWRLVPSANCSFGAEEQISDHILAFCPYTTL